MKNVHADSRQTPEDMLFDANLQEFARRVGLICALESGGKTSPVEAYKQIKLLWKQLKRSKKSLQVGQPESQFPESIDGEI